MDVNWHLFWKWLPDDQLDETISCDDAADRIIGAFINPYRRDIKFLRGDLVSTATVPFDWFEPCGDGTKPDFDKLELDDWGLTAVLGKYEVSGRSILRDFDPEYNQKCIREA